MGKSSQRKGRAWELEAERIFRDAGFSVTRRDIREADDLYVALGGSDWTVECKRRSGGFCSLYRFLDGADAVVHRDDRKPALITLELDRFLALARP